MIDSNASKIGPEFRINSYTIEAQRLPSVAALPNNSFIVVWQSNAQDSDGYGIFGQRFHFENGYQMSSSSPTTATTATTAMASASPTSVLLSTIMSSIAVQATTAAPTTSLPTATTTTTPQASTAMMIDELSLSEIVAVLLMAVSVVVCMVIGPAIYCYHEKGSHS